MDPVPIKTVAEAIREATEQLLAEDASYFVIGEGLGDAKRAFGTVPDRAKYPGRVWDMPVSENGMTGVCIGASIGGMKPILVHMRADFLLYSADQLINNAAKWFAMFGGQKSVPMVVRAVIGRGFGQGVQHSQHLEEWFNKIPGLTVVIPSNAYDAKGLLIWAARNQNPVLFFEHRWIHELKCEVPDEMYEVSPQLIRRREGKDEHLLAWGYMVHECMQVAKMLSEQGIEVSVNDNLRPEQLSGYINVTENSCCPPSPQLSKDFYPTALSIAKYVAASLCKKIDFEPFIKYVNSRPHDVPNSDFRGPF